LGSARGKVEIDIADVKKSTQQAGHDMKNMGHEAMNAGMEMQMAGMAITAAGAAITAAFVIATKTAIEFDKNMRNVNSIAHLSEEQFADLEDSVLSMSTRLPQSINELSKGLYDVYSSGFEGKVALDVLEVSAMGASAGLTDTATSSRGLMAVMNAYNQKTGPDANRIMDIMFATVEKGVVTFEQLAGSIGTVVNTSAVAGIEFKEIGAAIATMTLSGINADEATTALNQSIMHLIKPTDEASKYAKSIGINWLSAADGANHLKKVGLGKALDEIRKATHGDIGAMAQLMPEIRGLKGLLSLTKNEGKDFNEMLEAMDNSAGKTKRALDEQSKAVDYQASILKNYAEVISTSILTKVLPVFNALIIGLQQIAEWFFKLPTPIQGTLTGIVALTGVILLGMGAMLTYGATMGMVTKGLGAFSAQSVLAAGAVNIFNIALKGLMWIGIIVSLLTLAWQAGQWLNEKFGRTGQIIASLFGPIAMLGSYWKDFIKTLQKLGWIEEDTAKKTKKSAKEVKEAEDIKKAAKLAGMKQVQLAKTEDDKATQAAQLNAIARMALYLKDKQAVKSLAAAIMNSTKEEVKAFDEAQKKLYEWVGLFEEVPAKVKITGDQLAKRLKEQVQRVSEWAKNFRDLSKKIPPEMATELKQMGPAAAGQIEALNKLSGAKLDEYVKLWRKKWKQSYDVAKSEVNAGAERANLLAAGEKASKDWMDGLTEGITKNKGPLKSAVSSALDLLKKEPDKQLESKSPSLVSTRASENYMAGFIVGIQNKKAHFSAAVASVVAVLVKAANKKHKLTGLEKFVFDVMKGVNKSKYEMDRLERIFKKNRNLGNWEKYKKGIESYKNALSKAVDQLNKKLDEHQTKIDRALGSFNTLLGMALDEVKTPAQLALEAEQARQDKVQRDAEIAAAEADKAGTSDEALEIKGRIAAATTPEERAAAEKELKKLQEDAQKRLDDLKNQQTLADLQKQADLANANFDKQRTIAEQKIQGLQEDLKSSKITMQQFKDGVATQLGTMGLSMDQINAAMDDINVNFGAGKFSDTLAELQGAIAAAAAEILRITGAQSTLPAADKTPKKPAKPKKPKKGKKKAAVGGAILRRGFLDDVEVGERGAELITPFSQVIPMLQSLVKPYMADALRMVMQTAMPVIARPVAIDTGGNSSIQFINHIQVSGATPENAQKIGADIAIGLDRAIDKKLSSMSSDIHQKKRFR